MCELLKLLEQLDKIHSYFDELTPTIHIDFFELLEEIKYLVTQFQLEAAARHTSVFSDEFLH